MNEKEINLSTPNWLEAYPNKGVQDFFGFRYLRESNRRLVLGGGAANQFRSARPLLFYPAIAIEFRKQNKLDLSEKLSDIQLANWQRWFQVAHYLFINHSALKYGEVPDNGYAPALTRSSKISGIINGSIDEINITDHLPLYFDTNTRPFGYYKQYWIAPMGYFHSISSIVSCRIGEYAEKAYSMLSSYPAWRTLIRIIKTERFNSKDFMSLDPILDSFCLNPDEKTLAQHMILDKDNLNKQSAIIYRESYEQFIKLLENHEIYKTGDKESAIRILSTYFHRYLNKIDCYQKIEILWRILMSSFPFELGVVLFFKTFINRTEGLIGIDTIKRMIRDDIHFWLNEYNLKDDTLTNVASSFRKIYLNAPESVESVLKKLRASTTESDWVSGYVLGLLAYLTDKERYYKEINQAAYDSLTQVYYQFNPQYAFKSIEQYSGSFSAVLEQFAFSTFEQQYDFSLKRMEIGQNAKFLAIKHHDTNRMEFLVNADYISDKEGILDLIDGTISLWHSAGLLKIEKNKRILGDI